MLIKHCEKCGQETYHYIVLIYKSKSGEIIDTICACKLNGKSGCYKTTTYFVPVGTYLKTMGSKQ